MSTTAEATTVERLWRCPGCGHEEPFEPLDNVASRRNDARFHQCGPDQATVMRAVERERVYASAAERAIIENFEVSDWGLLEQAARHYCDNRRRVARKRPGVERVMAGVFARLDAAERACRSMRRYAQPDTAGEESDGGRIAWRWPEDAA